MSFPEEAKTWHDTSNSIITLSVKTERDLYTIPKALTAENIPYTIFREPDIGDAITAVAICPGPRVKEFCRKFQTALRPNRYVKVKKRDRFSAGTLKSTQKIEELERQERRLRQVVRDMESCEQTKGKSVLQHGKEVHRNLSILLRGIHQGFECIPKRFKIPEWLYENRELLSSSLFDDFTLEKYTIFHDCGKPYCLQVDDDGKKHFLNHANMSAKTYRGKCGNDEQVARLIEMDMDIHTLKAKDVPEFAARPEAVSLLLAGLAEIHANAEMFGGIESTNFKIKWKQINRRGKAICEAINKTNRMLGYGEKEKESEEAAKKSYKNSNFRDTR